MTRTVDEILEDIDTFAPADGNWQHLDALVEELWQHPIPARSIPCLFKVFERFPSDDGAGVFWAILHGVEERNDYEDALRESVARVPSLMGNIMLRRLEKAKESGQA